MKKIALILICIVAVGANMCLAQSNDSQTTANLGESLRGIQLSIVMMTNVFPVHSTAVVTFITKNSSPNIITVTEPASIVNSDVLLISDTGKLYDLTPSAGEIRILSALRQLNPGGEDTDSLSVTFPENIEPGDYMLKATRKFQMNGNDFTIESNPIKIRIIKWNDPQTITNWGQSVQGVQMGITTTTNIFRVGSSAVIESVIKNSSVSFITVLETIHGEYSDAVLTSDTGKLYHVTAQSNTFGYRFTLRPIQIGEQKVEPIQLTFGENIEEGDYKLKAIRKFSMGGKGFTLESNSIKVKIIK